jgi:hypothetical protein
MKTKNKPESDETILEHCICRDAAIRAAGGRLPNGKLYLGLNHDLGTALAERDYKAAKRKSARHQAWHVWIHRAIQIGIAVYVYINWDNLSPKMFLLLLGIFLWRSINSNFYNIRFLQAQTIELHTMAHPTAIEDFFDSEHCYNPVGRAWDLLHDKELNKKLDEKIAPWLAQNKYTSRHSIN